MSGLNPDILLVPSVFEGFSEEAAIGVKLSHFSPPTVAILYDLIPLIQPELYPGSGWVKDWYAERLGHLQRSDLWLAISEHSRREGIERLKLREDRVELSAPTAPMLRVAGPSAMRTILRLCALRLRARTLIYYSIQLRLL